MLLAQSLTCKRAFSPGGDGSGPGREPEARGLHFIAALPPLGPFQMGAVRSWMGIIAIQMGASRSRWVSSRS